MATFRHINSYHCIINEKNFCRFLQVGECISPYLQYFIKSNAELFFQFSHIFQDFTTVTFCRNPKRKNGKTNVQKKTLMKRGKALNFLFFIKKHRPVGALFDEELHHSYTFSEMKPFQKFFNLFYVVNSLGYLCKKKLLTINLFDLIKPVNVFSFQKMYICIVYVRYVWCN